MRLLTKGFLDSYPDSPEHMSELSAFVFYRTYSRWIESENRRETFKESIARAVDYNVTIALDELHKKNFVLSELQIASIVKEAETLFENVFNLKQFLSGRTHWVGGADTKVAEKFPLSNFNCSFIDVKDWSDMGELFYMLMLGVGVGLRVSKDNIKMMDSIRTDYTLTHSEFNPVKKEERLEVTSLKVLDNGYAKIYIGDDKVGWVDAFNTFIELVTSEEYASIKHIKISYNSIRPKGERLKTFGGTASGYEPLKAMFTAIDKTFRNELDTTLDPIVDGQLRPIHIADIANLMGVNVVVGGVRRTAEIVLCDEDDYEIINCKKDVLTRPEIEHRFMSNNSIIFETKPTRERLHEIFESIKGNGEPGFINMESGSKRRPNARGVNPCGEILLDNKGVCNLTTINVPAFVYEKEGMYLLDYQSLFQAQALSTRAGLRMTCLDLELPEWNEVHKRDRLIGCSLTGWKDAMDKLKYTVEQEQQLLVMLQNQVVDASIMYSSVLRIPLPLLSTTVKPEGTLSQVANGVSSGLHVSHAPFYIRRIRINANDPLVKVAYASGWHIDPEVGTPGNTTDVMMANAKTLVVSFPVKSGATNTRDKQTLKSQFDTYFMFQEFYTMHNSSITISVRDDEWEEAEQTIWDNWDDFVGVSFLPYDDSTYPLAPYEEITEEEYNTMHALMSPLDMELLRFYETKETEKDVENMTGCDTGACPIW